VAIKKTETVAPFVQTLFLVVAIGAWATELVFEIIQAAIVYRHNPNLSSSYTTFLYSAIIPLLLFGLATFLNRHYQQNRRIVFENVLIALVGMTFCSFISVVVHVVTLMGEVVVEGPLGWWWREIAVATVSFAVFVTVLLAARRTGRWS
jgi:hypothetical protein